jgi:eukaryotic-like serine/threonine-protein kinase
MVQTADHPTRAAPAEVVLGRYRLVRRLGAGGFGVVWLAHDERLDRAVAVKRVPMHDPATAARAEREAIAAARLSHPAIVALYEAGRDDEAVYLVSELVRGRTLAELMEDGELSDRDVLRVGVALCDALAHAHKRGVIHRDVKPGNVIVPDHPNEGAGVVKLTDFGIARVVGDDALTLTGDVVGTLAYMAPEQAEGREVDASADLYALALVVYEALSGVNPVRGRGAASTARRVGARLPPLGRLRRDLDPTLCAALDRAVLPRPEQRAGLGDLRAALADALPRADDAQGTIAGSPLEGLGGPVARAPVRPRARLVAGLGAGALTAAAVAWLGPHPPLQPLAAGPLAALAVAALPRLGWLAAAGAVLAWLLGGSVGLAGVAALVAVAAVPTVLLLRSAPTLWSVPAAAPVLGVAGLAGAWPALAGQAARPWSRAALGALGFWWLALAEALTGDRLALGATPGTAARPAWEASGAGALQHAVWPLLSGGALAVAALWAAAAIVLPILVRGRAFALDLVGATVWAAGLGSASQALVATLHWNGGAPSMRGLVAGAVAAGGLAVAAQASRGGA